MVKNKFWIQQGFGGACHAFPSNSLFFSTSTFPPPSRIKPLGDCKIYKRSEETKVEIGESIRGKDVFIIQTGSK